MDSFFITLDSTPTNEFPNNTSNHFRKRIDNNNIQLDRAWTVGLSSLFLPDTVQPFYPLNGFPSDAELVAFHWIEKDASKSAPVILDRDFTFLKSHLESSRTDSEIMYAAVNAYEYNKNKLKEGSRSIFRVSNRDTSLMFKKLENGDVIWDNSDTYLGRFSPRLVMDQQFALQMGYLKSVSDGPTVTIELGPNLKQTVLKDSNGRDRDSADLDRLWVENNWGTHDKDDYWLIAPNKKVYFSAAASWTFLLHNEIAFHGSQILQVRSNLIQSSHFNDSTMDLLTQVSYKRSNKGILHIEPTTIRYVPLRQPRVDIIEITLEDTSGKKIPLNGGPTNITLHFLRQ